MTRKAAREIAIQLCFAASASDAAVEDLLEDFFSGEHYESLGEEQELFRELPDEKQMEYIRELVTLTMDHRIELDRYIQRYARGWKPERISRTALAILRCAMCEILYMEDVPNAAARLRDALGVTKNVSLGARLDETFGTCLEKRSLEDALQDWDIDYRLDIKPW